MMTNRGFDVSRIGLSKLIGSFSAWYENGLIDALVDDKTVANCIIVNLTRS